MLDHSIIHIEALDVSLIQCPNPEYIVSNCQLFDQNSLGCLDVKCDESDLWVR